MINWEQVEQLQEDVGKDGFNDVVALFLEEVEDTLVPLLYPDALSDADLAAAFHFLKGSAYNLGFDDFGNLCATAEKAALEGQRAHVDLTKLRKTYRLSKEIFVENGFSNSEAQVA